MKTSFYKIMICFTTLLPIGCKTLEKLGRVADPDGPGNVKAAKFEQTIEHAKDVTTEPKKITVRFFGVPLKTAMRTLSDVSGEQIAWTKTLDDEQVIGDFIDQSIQSILESISRRHGVSLGRISDVYYLGEHKREDMTTAIVRVPSIDRDELKTALESVTSEHGRCTIIGSFVWISDKLETVRKIVSDLDEIRKRSERSYIAEVFFIRVNEEDFVQLTADLRIQSVDVFSSAFNINELFEMFVDGDGGIGSASIDMRPILYLSEGRKAVFEVGSELTKERKSVNDRGIIETTGYEKFTDGVNLSLLLNRTSNERYSVDMELDVSTFDKTDKNASIPAKNQSVLRSPGLLVSDGKVIYAGSLKKKEKAKIFGIFSMDVSSRSDMLTIWLRVREVQ